MANTTTYICPDCGIRAIQVDTKLLHDGDVFTCNLCNKKSEAVRDEDEKTGRIYWSFKRHKQ